MISKISTRGKISLWVITAGLIVLVVASGAYYLKTYTPSQNNPIQQTITPINDAHKQSKTYKSTEYRFEIEYPSGWSQKEFLSYINLVACYQINFFSDKGADKYLAIRIIDRKDSESIREAVIRIIPWETERSRIDNKLVLGNSVAEYYKDIDGHDPYDAVFSIHRDKIYMLQRGPELKEKEFQDILKTFQFFED